MDINKKYRLEKAVSKDPMRESLQNVYVTKRHATATNGHILAIVPVKSEDTDTPGPLSPDALKLGRKAMPKGLEEIRIALDGKQVLPDGVALPRPEVDGFPKLYRILRDAYRGRKYKIGINAGLLKDLSDAMGTDQVILEIQSPDKAVLVRPLKEDAGERGIIMPVLIRE
jgi:hypothetical protein